MKLSILRRKWILTLSSMFLSSIVIHTGGAMAELAPRISRIQDNARRQTPALSPETSKASRLATMLSWDNTWVNTWVNWTNGNTWTNTWVNTWVNR